MLVLPTYIFMLAEDRYMRSSVVILYTAYSFIRDITNPALCSKTRKIARPLIIDTSPKKTKLKVKQVQKPI